MEPEIVPEGPREQKKVENDVFFVWKKGVNPDEAIPIRKPDLCFVAAVAFENRVIGDKPSAGSLWIHGINL